jgi:hypothetical protein
MGAETQVAAVAPADAPATLKRGRDLGRVVRLEETCARHGRERVLRYADSYSTGDELAYAVLRDVRERDGFGWAEFHRALDRGADAVDDPPESLVALLDQAESVPAWVDHEQLRRGAIAYWRPGPLVVLCLTSAIGRGFKNYGGMKPTIFTGRLIDERRVGRRMVETLRYIATVTTPGAMARDRDGWKYTLRLRLLHASVRWGCSRAEEWDWDAWGLAVNDADNIGAPLEFSVGQADMLAQAGMRLEDQEVEDIVALWRYIDYVLGAPDHLLMTSAADARDRLAIMDALNHPPDDTNRLMLHSLVDFAAREGIGYDPLPAWLADRLPPRRRQALTYGLMYAWSDPEVREQMEIPRNAYRHVLGAVRPFIRARDLLTLGTPAGDARRCERVLRDFAGVTALRRDEPPLADPDEVASDIARRRGKTAALFGRAA